MRIDHNISKSLQDKIRAKKAIETDDPMSPYRESAIELLREAEAAQVLDPNKAREIMRGVSQLTDEIKSDILIAFHAKYGVEFDEEVVMTESSYWKDARCFHEVSVMKRERLEEHLHLATEGK